MDRFLRACWRQPVDRTPVWFMRQAGRYQPEYRQLREKFSIGEICRTPELCTQVTLLPVEQLGVDAAILFSDIMVPLQAIGIPVVIQENVGPVLNQPLRTPADVARLRPLEPEEDVPYVLEAIRLLRRELKVPLIGFAGAPFTLASYLIEGGPTRQFVETKRLMYGAPELWHELMSRLADLVVTFLRAQVAAGAQAVQLFDSWVGCLSPQDYQAFALPYSRRILQALADCGVPRIHFGVGTASLLPLMRAAGADVVGVDWTVPLDEAWERVGTDVAIQGNLDPAVLLGPPEWVEQRARDVLARAGGRPGHIFNLGHGVLRQTSPSALRRLVDVVHAYQPQG